MEKIVSFLKDPAWWFTAVFIAIIASLAAGFSKDAVQNIFAKFSKTYQIKRDERERKFQIEVEALLRDKEYMIFTFLRSLTQIVACMTLITIFIMTFMIATIYSLQEPARISLKYTLYIVSLISGIGTLWGTIYSTPRIQALKRAYNNYRKRILKNREDSAQPVTSADAKKPRR